MPTGEVCGDTFSPRKQRAVATPSPHYTCHHKLTKLKANSFIQNSERGAHPTEMGLEYWNGYTTLSATQTHWCKGDAKLRRGTPLPLQPIRSASQEPCGKQRLALEKAPQHEPRCRAAGPKGRSFLCPQLCRNLEWNSVPRSRLMFVDACISTKEENAQSFCFFIFD